MKKPIYYLVIALSVAATFIGIYANYYFSTGKNAPAYNLSELSLPDLDKKLVSGDEWRGKIVVVNHWAPWCPPCREEMPILMQFQEDMASQGVEVVGVSHDLLENTVIFADNIGLNYSSMVAIVDGKKILEQQGNQTGALPFTVVFDRQGNLKQTFLGKLTYQQLYDMVSPLLDNDQKT